MESNPLHGRTAVLFYTSGTNRIAQGCDMANAGCLLLWHAQVIKTISLSSCYTVKSIDLELDITLVQNILSYAVFRSLGIPCRVVTNYESAHDTNSNLLIERYYNEIDEDISDDSIW